MTPPVVLQVNTARGWRGGERQVLWLTERLNAWGCTSIVASPPDEPLASEVIRRGLPHVAFAPRGEWDVIAIRRLRLSAHAHGVTLLNSHDGHANTLAAFARSGNQRFVITRRVHHALRNNLISKWKFARADRVIAISNAVADVLRANGVASDRIRVIHSGVALERARIAAAPHVLRALGLTPGRPLAIMVGVAGHKDPFTFVRAIAAARSALPELEALIIGRDKLAARVSDEIDELGLRDAVFMTGHRNDVDELICAGDVVVMSSNAEGLGTIALDAMWAGKPLVATRTAAIGDFAVHEHNALLAPVADALELGRQVVRALTDCDLSRRMVANASHTVEGFSADATARRTLALYRSLSDNPRPVMSSA